MKDDLKKSDIKTIRKLVDKIIQSKGDIFYINESKFSGSYISCKDKYIFNKIDFYLKKYFLIEEIYSSFPIHVFNPYIELFIRNFNDKFMIDAGIKKTTNHLFSFYPNDIDDLTDKVAIYNGFIDSIRSGVESQQFKKDIGNYRRTQNQNYQGLKEYIDWLFQRHSRLLILRVDFGYTKDESTCRLTKEEIYKKYSEVQKDRKELFNLRSNKLLKNILGFVWKLEYEKSNGFHYHTIFFFDGLKQQADINIADQLGDYWKDTITKGDGLYNNHYECLEINMIDPNGTQLIENLKSEVAKYLIESDDYVKIATVKKNKQTETGEAGVAVIDSNNSEIKRTFGRGEIKAKTSNGSRSRE